jgi:hypothetical protein
VVECDGIIMDKCKNGREVLGDANGRNKSAPLMTMKK